MGIGSLLSDRTVFMGIKLSRSDALADAIASVRMEGLRVPPAALAVLERWAAREITIEEAKAILLAPHRQTALASDESPK
jgi:hypothetical protein